MTSSAPLSELLWPQQRLGEALGLLSRAAGLRTGHLEAELSEPPESSASDESPALREWLEDCGDRLGIELTPAAVLYPELPLLLASPIPALLQVPGGPGRLPGYALLVGASRRRVWLLSPDQGRRKSIPTALLSSALRQSLDEPYLAPVEQILERAGVPSSHRSPIRRKLLDSWLSRTPIPNLYTLRLPPSANWPVLLESRGIFHLLGALLGNNLVALLLVVVGALILGESVLLGRPALGWLLGWGLALLSQVSLDTRALWLEGQLALRATAALGQRLLSGTFLLPPQAVRSAGIGQFLGVVMESDTLGRLLMSGLPTALTSGPELFLCAVLLAGARLVAPLVALAVVAAVGLTILSRYHRQLGVVLDRRLALSTAMIERMLGHRTRLVQQPAAYWHREEDAMLAEYQSAAQRADRLSGAALGVLPRSWLFLGLLTLLPRLLEPASTPELALALGVVLWAQRALYRLILAGLQLVEALLAYRRLQPLLAPGSRPLSPGVLLPADSRRSQLPGTPVTPLFDLVGVSFGYPAQSLRVINQLDLAIFRGERVLLQGPSGGGKSTLAAMLLGLESPTSGVVLLSGLDLTVLGMRRWRRRVAGAPQFHLNHVLSESLAFNLLMGRRWPASDADYQEAAAICRGLGLGALLDRMPGGLFQAVGDGGWRLSHGERSRLFLARALLQQADVVVLDESFAAMDPETLRRCLDFVWQRPETIITIAHP